MDELLLAHRVARLNALYSRSLDCGHLEDWPQYFTDACSYRITNLDNHANGLAGSLIYAKGKGMLLDRVQALRGANIYEAQTYRHVVGMPLLGPVEGQAVTGETPFMVLRTMRTGAVAVFASGVYHDSIALGAADLKFIERVVVCDSSRVDTLLAIPL